MKLPYGAKLEVGLPNARLESPGTGAPKTKEDSEPANCIPERVPYESKLRTVQNKVSSQRKRIGSRKNSSNHGPQKKILSSNHGSKPAIESHLIEANKVTGSESLDL